MMSTVRSVFLFLLVAQCSFAQEQSDVPFNQTAEDYFFIGLKQYTHTDYELAFLTFLKIHEELPLNQRSTAAYIMEAKSLYRLGDFPEAVRISKDFLVAFPSSLYAGDAHYTMGESYYRMQQYPRAASEMLFVIQNGRDSKNISRAVPVFENIVREFLNLDEMRRVRFAAQSRIIKKLLTLYIAEKEYEQDSTQQALSDAKRVLAIAEPSPADERARILIARIEHGSSLTIGVLLPLMTEEKAQSPIKKLADDVYDGIKFAADEYNTSLQHGGMTVTLDVRDSERDTAVAMNQLERWISNKDCIGVVGPMFSNVAFAIAPTANAEQLPLISPTATDNGIAAIGPYIFQANPDFTTRGRVMAQYAVLAMGYKNLAVMAPVVPSSTAMADAFIEEAKKLGAVVVSDKRYIQGTGDLRYLFREMRMEAAEAAADTLINLDGTMPYTEVIHRLQNAGITKSRVDSLTDKGFVDPEKLFGSDGEKIADSLGLPLERVVTDVDSTQYPATGIQAVYCPISAGTEIGVITSQITYFNIAAAILGSGEWYDANQLELNKRYADGVVFSSDRWVNNSPEYARFSENFFQAMSRQPNDNVLFGYDVMSLILSVIRNGATTRDQLSSGLAGISGFEGFHSKISFAQNRVNSFLNLLRYHHEKVEKIGDIQYRPVSVVNSQP
jgi:ABC-type branched-subunit amino acid transport system substrate-binding protein